MKVDVRPVRASLARIIEELDLAIVAGVYGCAKCRARRRIGFVAAQNFILPPAGDRGDRIAGQADEPLIDPLYPAFWIGNDDGATRPLDDGDQAALPLGGGCLVLAFIWSAMPIRSSSLAK